MRSLSKAQFEKEEKRIRKLGYMNSGYGYIGNGFYYGMYPSFYGASSGYGGVMSTAMPQDPVSSSGETASASDGAGVSAVGGMASE